MHEAVSKDGDIGLLTGWVGALNPYQVALQNVEADLISQRRLPFELEGCKCVAFRSSSFLEDAEVSAVDPHQAVIPAAAIFPAFKINLISDKIII